MNLVSAYHNITVKAFQNNKVSEVFNGAVKDSTAAQTTITRKKNKQTDQQAYRISSAQLFVSSSNMQFSDTLVIARKRLASAVDI